MDITTYAMAKKYTDNAIEQSGGTTVVANPEEEATETLEKIQIGDVVFSLSARTSSGSQDTQVPTNVTITEVTA